MSRPVPPPCHARFRRRVTLGSAAVLRSIFAAVLRPVSPPCCARFPPQCRFYSAPWFAPVFFSLSHRLPAQFSSLPRRLPANKTSRPASHITGGPAMRTPLWPAYTGGPWPWCSWRGAPRRYASCFPFEPLRVAGPRPGSAPSGYRPPPHSRHRRSAAFPRPRNARFRASFPRHAAPPRQSSAIPCRHSLPLRVAGFQRAMPPDFAGMFRPMSLPFTWTMSPAFGGSCRRISPGP